MQTSSDDVAAASTEVTIEGIPHRIDWHAGEEGGRLVIHREPHASGSTGATFAFAVFGGGIVEGHWVSRPVWVRPDEVARAVFAASREMLAPLADAEEGEHTESAAIAVEVLDDRLR